MGEIADSIVEGEVCQFCMQPFDEPLGYPASCAGCEEDDEDEEFSEDYKNIIETGASVDIRNNGQHFIIKKGNLRVDFWPSTKRYRVNNKEPGWGLASLFQLLENTK